MDILCERAHQILAEPQKDVAHHRLVFVQNDVRDGLALLEDPLAEGIQSISGSAAPDCGLEFGCLAQGCEAAEEVWLIGAQGVHALRDRKQGVGGKDLR